MLKIDQDIPALIKYIKISKTIALIDTPGILAPSYEDELVVMRLALVGTIRQEILPLEKNE